MSKTSLSVSAAYHRAANTRSLGTANSSGAGQKIVSNMLAGDEATRISTDPRGYAGQTFRHGQISDVRKLVGLALHILRVSEKRSRANW
ncbi:hypothetical protein JQK15_15610 [Sphingobium sp. BHU LFT2]|uniref:hypothetical protein n=1 Tax=Sphingobium sp. BHU LFT2 TaxID=2807634 RepID=UPI001BE8BD8D|nr:hypothetical protein [Sphingobium sp. BHU LFT2]MBT2244969.1 hypothetical protein [Sphingobium sp. BHU LFT2]